MMDRSQHGQALPLGMALAMVGMLGALVLHDTGRVAIDKARLANAADAAAYSGLLWQARALNYQAYTNRAMVANQVSIAQAVSLRSWSEYAERTSGNLADVLSLVPPIKVYAEGVAQAMTALNELLAPAAEAMVRVMSATNRAIALSQEAMYGSSFAATPDIVETIARSSDPRFRADSLYALAGLGANLEQWRGFTRRHDRAEGDPMRARAELIEASLDDFSAAREWKLFDGFWFHSTPLTRHKLFREGRTRLVTVERGGELRREWRAVDTLSMQTRVFNPLGSDAELELPVGWGAARVGSEPGSGRSCAPVADGVGSGACDDWTVNPVAERLGFRDIETIRGRDGLNAFRTLSAATLGLARKSGDPVVRLRTEISVDTSAIGASGDGVAGDVFRAEIVAPGNVLSSVAAAELYYRRPDDGQDAVRLSDEGATGYNPYWAVRLAPVSSEERLSALGSRRGVGRDAASRRVDRDRRPSTIDRGPAVPQFRSGDGGLTRWKERAR